MNTNYYYISTGQKGKKYTLRHAYTDVLWNGRRVERDHFEVSLSTDWDDSVARAKAHLGNSAHLLQEGTPFALEKITHRSPEELARLRTEASYAEGHRVDVRVMNWGVSNESVWTFPWGKFKDLRISEVAEINRGYLEWVVSKMDADNPKLFELMIQTYLEKNQEVKKESNYVGKEKDRIVISGKVMFKKEINKTRYSYYDSDTQTLYKIVDADGNIFTSFYSGHKFDADLGETVTVKATVKKHDEYRGEKQTVVNRLQVV